MSLPLLAMPSVVSMSNLLLVNFLVKFLSDATD